MVFICFRLFACVKLLHVAFAGRTFHSLEGIKLMRALLVILMESVYSGLLLL